LKLWGAVEQTPVSDFNPILISRVKLGGTVEQTPVSDFNPILVFRLNLGKLLNTQFQPFGWMVKQTKHIPRRPGPAAHLVEDPLRSATARCHNISTCTVHKGFGWGY